LTGFSGGRYNGEHNDISEDYRSEKRTHTHLVDLETLDVAAMVKELEKFKVNNQYWLFGPSSIMNATGTASCSGLAYALLKDGGIGKLVPPGLTIRDKIVVTPNNLSRLVLLAKEKEESSLRSKDENTIKPFKP
jgi:hypothetical protein